jgi:hypothetical protein
MSQPVVLLPPHRLTVRQRCEGITAVGVGRFMLAVTRGRPARIRAVLAFLHRRTVPARTSSARAAHAAVTTVSLRCASNHGCLLRSIAVVLLCRMHGQRVLFVVGFSSPPPASHAWVETETGPIGEPFDPRLRYTPAIVL